MDLASYLGIGIMFVLAAAFATASGVAAHFLRPRHPTPEKLDPYESGIVPEYEPAERFPVGFYLVSVIFIAFDIEVIFLYPWAVRMRQLQLFGFFEMLVFVVIVLIAYAYVRKEGILDWAPRSKLDREQLMERYRAEAVERARPDDHGPAGDDGSEDDSATEAA